MIDINKDWSEFDKKKKAYEISNDTRKFEIELFWRRSVFFWGFLITAFVALGAFYSNETMKLVISSFGLIGSLSWTLVNKGSKYWYENWEKKIRKLEDEITGPLFKEPEEEEDKGIWGGKRYSVSRLAISLSCYVTILWFFIFTNTLFKLLNWLPRITTAHKVGALALVTFVWIVAIFFTRVTKLE